MPPTSGAAATSLEWLLPEAARGQVFAAGHAERGNDLPVLLSTTKAERVDGGYRFTGHKSFGSLTPVWTYLGIHGMDTSDPAPESRACVHAPRHGRLHIQETWDTLGMRATRSDDTVLDGAFVPDDVARVVPRARQASTLSCSASSRGRSWVSGTSITDWRNARST